MNLAGGCCGNTPEHIAAIAKAVADRRAAPSGRACPAPCACPARNRTTTRRTNNSSSSASAPTWPARRKFAKLVRAGDLEGALAMARQQVENGANVIDICFDDGLIEGKDMMVEIPAFVQTEPDIAKVPIMVDSSKWEILEAGLQCLQGKGIVNSISLKEGEEKFREQAGIIKRYGAAVVVMAFDEHGQAATYEDKIRICEPRLPHPRRRGRLQPGGHHLRPQHPHRRHRHGGAQQLRGRFHQRHQAGSNTTCPAPACPAASPTFRSPSAATTPCARPCTPPSSTTPARPAWTWASSTPACSGVYDEIPPVLLEHVEDVLLNRRPDATERLLELAEQFKGQGGKKTDGGPRLARRTRSKNASNTPCSRASTGSSRRTPRPRWPKYGKPLKVIEGPLMDGMGIVGDLVRRGENVPAPGGEIRPRHEKGRGLAGAAHGGGEARQPEPSARPASSSSPPSRATSTTSAKTSSAWCSPAMATRSPTWA